MLPMSATYPRFHEQKDLQQRTEALRPVTLGLLAAEEFARAKPSGCNLLSHAHSGREMPRNCHPWNALLTHHSFPSDSRCCFQSGTIGCLAS